MKIIEILNKNIIRILLLCAVVGVYSISSVFTKMASTYEFLSTQYILCLAGAIFILGVYAVLWQLVLKTVELNKAYLFRSLGIVYNMSIAYFLFHEQVSLVNLIGSGFVVTGVVILLSEKK